MNVYVFISLKDPFGNQRWISLVETALVTTVLFKQWNLQIHKLKFKANKIC